MIALGASGTLQASATNASTVDVSVSGLLLSSAIPPVSQAYEVLSAVGQQVPSSVGAIVTLTSGQEALISSVHFFNTSTTTSQTVGVYLNGTTIQIASFAIPPLGWANYEDGEGWQVYNSQGTRQ